MENTIQGLLDFARPAELHRVPLDLRETVQRALNLVEGRAAHARVAVIPALCEQPLPVVAPQTPPSFPEVVLKAISRDPVLQDTV